MNKDYLLIGKIVGVHGIKGEVKLMVFGADEGSVIDEGCKSLPWKNLFLHFNKAKKASVSDDEFNSNELKHYVVNKSRRHKGQFLVFLDFVLEDESLKPVSDRNESEKLRGTEVYILKEELPELEDSFYLYELIGFTVMSFESNGESKEIGTLKDVSSNGANDLYVVEDSTGNEILIPETGDTIKEINSEEKTIVIELLEGLIE